MAIKQFTVTFEFDTEKESISNLKTFVDGIEKKKRRTRSITKNDDVMEDEALITRESNKICFNNKCYAEMSLTEDDRIIVKYEQKDGDRFPIIGTDTAFDQEGSGNKITKSKTSSYRGKANTVLAEYGTEFTIELYRPEGIWKMVSKDGISPTSTFQEVEEKAKKVEVDLITTDEGEEEIEELTFKL